MQDGIGKMKNVIARHIEGVRIVEYAFCGLPSKTSSTFKMAFDVNQLFGVVADCGANNAQ